MAEEYRITHWEMCTCGCGRNMPQFEQIGWPEVEEELPLTESERNEVIRQCHILWGSS